MYLCIYSTDRGNQHKNSHNSNNDDNNVVDAEKMKWKKNEPASRSKTLNHEQFYNNNT